MRWVLLFVFVVATVVPAGAIRRVTVAQLEQALAADQIAHRADADIARQIADFELTERLTDSTLDRFAAQMPLGPKTAVSLQLLSDRSAFLDPPASEFPATAQPDPATQQRMMDAARGYVVDKWSRQLPNFFVTRDTNRFDDTPQVLEKGGWPVRAGLHHVGTANRQITYREGQEVQDSSVQTASTGAKTPLEVGLRTWGEFGPALTVILTDAARGTVTFSHWEQTRAGLAAVYHYAVPREASHYAVSYCCTVDEHVVGRTQFGYSGRDRSASQVANIPRAEDSRTYNEVPAYKGEISIDPASGAVLRITLEAALKPGGPLVRAATMVQYAPVSIGDRKFICPVRSLALSVQNGGKGVSGPSASATTGSANDTEWQGSVSGQSRDPVLMLNETRFTGYHRLGTSMRIVNDTAASGPSSTAPPNSETSNTAISEAAPVATNPPAAPTPSSINAASDSAADSAPHETSPPAPTEPVVPEISMTAATSLPDTPVNSSQSQDAGYSLKITSRLVDIGIVATDKKGHPIKDLKPGDFEIYDNGQKQEIRSFGEFESQSVTTPVSTPFASAPVLPSSFPQPAYGFTNRATVNASLVPATDSGSTILLLDESHIAWGDLTHARQELLKFLSALASTERVGLYTMMRSGPRVLIEVTTDHAALSTTLKNWKPSAQSVSQAQDEEMRSRQQINEVRSVADLNSVNGNQIDVPDADSTTDPQLRSMGSNPARAALIQLVGVARHLSTVPGHKNLVWISSDNVFADWENQAVGIDKSPKMIDSYALRAQEAMNDAHVAVYPFDVSQLESAAITADIQHRNVELTQAAADTASLASSATGGGGASGARNMSPGRITAEMQQDTHAIQGPVRQIAAATGGRVIRRSADLAGELGAIVDDGHATYMLSFSPSGQADGLYHNINVKLTGKRGVTLRYRTGYIFQKEPSTLKERFQQAVWRSVDVNEIAVTADVAAAGSGANVKINIAAADLGMQQQADRWMDKLDIFFIQRDDDGHHAQVEGQTLGLRLKSSTYQSLMPSGIPFDHFVQMQSQMASLRVLVVDENSGRMGSITIPATAIKVGHQ
jgi:VWFA-related protein